MKTVRNLLNYQQTAGEWNDEVSKTIPDQTMSMRTILERHSRGLPVIGNDPLQAHYEDPNEENFGINPKTLDLAELQALKENNKEDIGRLQQRLQEQEAAAKAKQLEDAAQAAAEKAFEELKKKRKTEDPAD